MKKIALLLMFSGLTTSVLVAQGPTLNLVGGSPSLSKGTINTEVLSEIIQQKQEEVKKRVFRNTIVKGFSFAPKRLTNQALLPNPSHQL